MLGTSHTNVIGLGTQDRTIAAKRVDLFKEKFEFLPITRNDTVAGLRAQLEPFSMAIGKKWMAGLGVATRHNTITVEEKERR